MSFDVNWDIDKYKEEHESEDHWMLRRNFLERWKESFPEERLVCLARVFVNMEFMGCKYPLPVMQEVARMSKEVNIDITCSTKIANTPSYRYFGGNGDSPRAKKRPASISRPFNFLSKKAKQLYNEFSSSDDQNFTSCTPSPEAASISEPANTLKHMDMSSNNITFSNCYLTSPEAVFDSQSMSLGSEISKDISRDPSCVFIDHINSEVSILISDDEDSVGGKFEDTFVIENGTKCMKNQSRNMRMWYTKDWVRHKYVHNDQNQSLHTKHSVDMDRLYEIISTSSSEDPNFIASLGVEDQIYYTIIGTKTCTIPLAKYYWKQLKDHNINKTFLKNQYAYFWKVQSKSTQEKMNIDHESTSRCVNDRYIWAKYNSRVPTEESNPFIIYDSDHLVKQAPLATIDHKIMKKNNKEKSKKIETEKFNLNEVMANNVLLMDFFYKQSQKLPAKYFDGGLSKTKLKIIKSWMALGATKHEAQILCYSSYKRNKCISNDKIVEILKLRSQQSPYSNIFSSNYGLNSAKLHGNHESPTQAQELSSQMEEQQEKSLSLTTDSVTSEQKKITLFPISEEAANMDEETAQQQEKISTKIFDVDREPDVEPLCQVRKLADISLRFILELMEKSYHKVSKPSFDLIPDQRLNNLTNKSSSQTSEQTLNTGSPNREHTEKSFVVEQANKLQATSQSLCQVPKLSNKSFSQILENDDKKLLSLVPKLADKSKSDIVVQSLLEQEQDIKSLHQVQKLADISSSVILKQAKKPCLCIPEQNKPTEKFSIPIPEQPVVSNHQIAVNYEQNEKSANQNLQQSKKRTKEVLEQSSDSLHHTPEKSTMLLELPTTHADCTDTIIISEDEAVPISEADTLHRKITNTIKERQQLKYHKSKGESQSIHGTSKSTKALINLEKSKAEFKYNQLRVCIRDTNKIISSNNTKILQAAIIQSINDEKIRFLRFLAKDDCLVIICADKMTRDWLDNLVPTLQPWPRANLVIVKDLPPPVIAKAFIPFVPNFFHNHLEPYALLDKLHEQNLDIGCDKWEVFKSKKATDGQSLILLFDCHTDVVLQAQQYRLNWAFKPKSVKLISLKPINFKEPVLSSNIIDLCIDDTTAIDCNNEPIQMIHSESIDNPIPFDTESKSRNIFKTDDVRMNDTTLIAPVGTSQSQMPPDNFTSSYLQSSRAITLPEPTNSLPIEQVIPSSLVSENYWAQDACSKDIFDENVTTEELLMRFASNYYNNLDVNLQLSRRGSRCLFWTKLGATPTEANIMTQIAFKHTAEHNEMVKRFKKLAKKRAKIQRENKSIIKKTNTQGENSAAAKRARLKSYIEKDRELRLLRVCIKDAKKNVRQEELIKLQLIIQQSIDDALIRFLRFSTQDGCLVVFCSDYNSRDWLEKRIPYLDPWPGAHLTIVDLQLPLTARVFIPEFPIKYLQPYALLGTLHNDNPDVGCDKWEFVRSQLLKGGAGVRLTFRFDFKANEALRSKRYHLKWKSGTILVKLKKKDKKLTMSHNNKGKNLVDDSADSSSEDDSPEEPSKSTINVKELPEMKVENTLIQHKDEDDDAFSNEVRNIAVTASGLYTEDNDAPSRTQRRDLPEPSIPEKDVKPAESIALTENTYYSQGHVMSTSVNEQKEIARASQYMTTRLGIMKEEPASDNKTENVEIKHIIQSDSEVSVDKEHRNSTVIRSEDKITNEIKGGILNDKYLPQKGKGEIKGEFLKKSPWFGHLIEEHKAAVGLSGYPPLGNKSNTAESYNHQATDRTVYETVEKFPREGTRYGTRDTTHYMSAENKTCNIQNYSYPGNTCENLEAKYCETKYDHASACPPQPDIIDITGDDYPITKTENTNEYSGMEYRAVDPREREFSYREAVDYTGIEPRTDFERVNTFSNEHTNPNRVLHYSSNDKWTDAERKSEGFNPSANREEYSQRRTYDEEITSSRHQRDNRGFRTESPQFVEDRNVYPTSSSGSRGRYYNDRNVYQRTENYSGIHRSATDRRDRIVMSAKDQDSSFKGGPNKRSSSRDQYRNNEFERDRQSRY